MAGKKRYNISTPNEGKDGKTYWTRIGVAFPTKNGDALNGYLNALPVNGKIYIKEATDDDRRGSQQEPDTEFGNGDDTPF